MALLLLLLIIIIRFGIAIGTRSNESQKVPFPLISLKSPKHVSKVKQACEPRSRERERERERERI
jgi:hypothetical protein